MVYRISREWLQTTYKTLSHPNHGIGIKKRVGTHLSQIFCNTIVVHTQCMSGLSDL